MKRFLLWLLAVIATVFCVDLLVEIFFSSYIKKHTLPGDYESIEKVLRHNDSDLLILGSSVSLNSVDTKALEDSLGLKAFNGGGNGQTFPFFLTMLKAAITNHTPQKIILCMQPSALVTNGLGNRYNLLVPYYGLNIADIDENMIQEKKINKWLLNSSLYKLNTIWFRILLYHFITPDVRGENGHVAKPIPPYFPEKNEGKVGVISPKRLKELNSFMEICKENDIDLTILFTPLYTNFEDINTEGNVIKETMELAKKYNFSVYNDIELEPFASNPELFYDNAHININGTKIYTDTLLKRLK